MTATERIKQFILCCRADADVLDGYAEDVPASDDMYATALCNQWRGQAYRARLVAMQLEDLVARIEEDTIIADCEAVKVASPFDADDVIRGIGR